MKWIDQRMENEVPFYTIPNGECFECDDIAYIKLNNTEAFDICNNKLESIEANKEVLYRDSQLTLY